MTFLPSFSNCNGAKFLYGDFLNAAISFLMIAAAVYFFVVLPVNSLLSRVHKQAAPDKEAVSRVQERDRPGCTPLCVLHLSCCLAFWPEDPGFVTSERGSTPRFTKY